ncbi:MAG: beta-ketoacyl synthase N-terminal-like domain-containing protein, partial [Candidatus Sulfotelmatobacter sp.]
MTDIHKTIVVTGVGVVSPYGIGLDRLQAGMLSGKCCLSPTKDLYSGFEGSTAQVLELPPLAEDISSRYSRTDQLAVMAAQDAIANSGCDSSAFLESGIMMASTVGG